MNRVFISSTSLDLAAYRAAAIETCLRIGLQPIAMEFFETSPDGAFETSRRKLDESDVYIGIYAYRYGYIPPGFDKSIIELEFDYASEIGLDRLCFFVDDAYIWPRSDDENYDNIEKLRAFKNKINRTLIRSTFTSVDNFQLKLVQSLIVWKERNTNSKESSETGSNVSKFDIDELFLENIIIRTIEKYDSLKSKSEPSFQIMNNSKAIGVEPIFGLPPNDIQFKCDVFMIMPFAKEFTSIYEDYIKPTIQELNLTIKRGDVFKSDHNIMDEIWAALFACKLVIADCTGRNANVFYELGIAHTLGKPTILITQNVDDVPFDVLGRRFVVYEDKSSGLKALCEKIKSYSIIIVNKLDDDT